MCLAASISGCQAAPAATEEASATTATAASGTEAPVFEVDPFWPKPLPNHWVTGSTIGLSVDAQGNVWTIHRGGSVEDNFKAADIMVGDARSQDEETKLALPDVPVFKGPIGRCCKVAPPVLVYAPDGKLLKSWGGPGQGYNWPESNHGITVDHQGNVWIAGNGAKDSQILKFDGDGKFLMQIGKPGMNGGSNDTANFKRPTKIWVDPKDNEVYVSDGYDNRRVIVFDANTGAYKRHWGAYGARPSDEPMPPYNPNAPPSKQFSTVHCVIVSNDGFVYVCDRVNDRIQVFEKSGKFVREARIDPHTFRSGAVWDMTFSHDPEQKYIFAANGVDEKINVLLRSTLEVLTTFGDGGRYPGQFFGVHNVATDAQGNLYTAETYTGARVQKFIFKGIRSVPADQGVPWPEAARGN
jgi:hypothetical protein